MNKNITADIKYIGVDDTTLDLFESQYIIPNGISYNSYLITDEKVAIMDTVDLRKSDDWWENLEEALADRTPDYLIVQHMEPDHAGNIVAALEKYPNIKIVASAKAIQMLPQFFENVDFSNNTIAVKENDTLCGVSQINVADTEEAFDEVEVGDSWRPQYDYMLFKKSVDVVYCAERAIK